MYINSEGSVEQLEQEDPFPRGHFHCHVPCFGKDGWNAGLRWCCWLKYLRVCGLSCGSGFSEHDSCVSGDSIWRPSIPKEQGKSCEACLDLVSGLMHHHFHHSLRFTRESLKPAKIQVEGNSTPDGRNLRQSQPFLKTSTFFGIVECVWHVKNTSFLPKL